MAVLTYPVTSPGTIGDLMDTARDAQAQFEAGYIATYGALPLATTSPGKLRILYSDTVREHHISVNMLYGENPFDLVTWAPLGYGLAIALAGCLGGAHMVLGWETRDSDNHIALQDAFTVPLQGGKSRITNDAEGLSFSVTINGHGLRTNPNVDAGYTSLRYFPIVGYEYRIGTRYQPVNVDLATFNLALLLASSQRYWGDFYGVKAGIRGDMPLQFNAFVQRKWGR